MAGRADEMVIAGMKPHSIANSANPFLALHRGISFILFVDSLIILLIVSQLVYGFSNSTQTTVMGVLAALLMINWLAYRNRHPMVYWLGAAVIGLAGAFFAINALTALYSVITGNVSSLLWVFLFTWAMFGSFRRSLSHFHPGYKNAYAGRVEEIPGLELEPGEMLAACPHCMAVLAIRPDLLNSKDDCPYCKLPLVNSQLASKYEEE
ncbi:MAG: hypothetical protein ACI8T6_000679 [Candidatus Poseidoniaceae archaeon]|jgi:hypothetical protein